MSLEGIGVAGSQWCGICQRYHEPSTAICQRQGGHIEFTPYRTPDAVPVPPEIRWHNPTPVEQKLDNIIEQLEFICNELRRNKSE